MLPAKKKDIKSGKDTSRICLETLLKSQIIEDQLGIKLEELYAVAKIIKSRKWLKAGIEEIYDSENGSDLTFTKPAIVFRYLLL